MNNITKFLIITSLLIGVFIVAYPALAGMSLHDLGLVLFPAGFSNAQPFRIELDTLADSVTATPQFFGETETFLYDDISGRGLAKIQETLFSLQVDEQTPSTLFTQYLHTGQVSLPQGVINMGGVIQGDITIAGMLVHIEININTTPWMTTVSMGGVPFGSAPVYPQSNYAPFIFGNVLYAVEPNAPTQGTFQVHTWMQYSDATTSGVYALPLVPSNVVHPVISEIQTTGGTGATANDFVEFYNPGDTPFNLKGHRLVKRTSGSVSDSLIKSWTGDIFIPAHGFYLWANSNYTGISVQPDATTTQSIANNNGIALRFGTTTSAAIIDSVAWGSVTNGFNEGTALPGGLAAGESYERKMWQDIACFTPQGAGESMGNGCDTDDNASDFEVRTISNPQNSVSMPEPL